jgi:hypothetical protein
VTNDRQRTRFYATRPRRVPPEFCNDEPLESCSLLAALLLYRLVSQADDQGRLPGHPKSVRAVCFPMRPLVSERKVSSAIDELVRAGFLIRYDLKGRMFLQVDGWHDLQGKWGRRAYPSRYPAPPGWTHDWVSVKDDEDLHAPSTQGASGLHSPIPVPPPVPFASPITGLPKPSAVTGRNDHLNDLLEMAQHGPLTDEEAFEIGTALLDQSPVPRRMS